ncbi:MAG TPA: hypothetical protein VE089_02600 [Nitrososphaeraceae archaeon]|nr:hypothetical protein [Nitrososphaeraceae archaeon]
MDPYLNKTERKKVIESVYHIIKNKEYNKEGKFTVEYIESEIGYIEHNNITKKHIRYAIFYLMKTKKIKRIKCFGEDGKIDYCYTENR